MSKQSRKCAVCEMKTDLKACSGCGHEFYCSVDHQKVHWRTHKGNCKPFRISTNDTLGRFLEATHDVKAGSVIVVESPLVFGPDWNYDLFESTCTMNCVGCYQPIRILNARCPKCRWPCCGVDCVGLQNAKLHDDVECALLKGGLGVKHENDYRALRDYYRTDILLSLKCLLLQIESPKKFQQLMNLQSHEKARKTSTTFMESEKQIDYLERNFLNPLAIAEENAGKIILAKKDRRTLQKILGIIETNALYLTGNNEISGLFAIGCIIEHSCYSNCHFEFNKKNGFKLTVRSARDIKAGEHISTCYSNVLWGTLMRRQQLKETKYFNCCCLRCEDPTELQTHFSSMRCIGTDEMSCNGIQVPLNPLSDDVEWACNKCPIRVSGNNVAFLVDKMGEEIDNVIQKTPNVPAVESLMEKLSTFLHPNHYHMFALKHSLIQLYGNHKDAFIETIPNDSLERKLKFCDELLDVVAQLDPFSIRLSIYIAVVLYEKFNSIAEMHRRQLSKIPYSLTEAMSCLKRAQTLLINELDTVQGRQLNGKISDAMRKMEKL